MIHNLIQREVGGTGRGESAGERESGRGGERGNCMAYTDPDLMQSSYCDSWHVGNAGILFLSNVGIIPVGKAVSADILFVQWWGIRTNPGVSGA